MFLGARLANAVVGLALNLQFTAADIVRRDGPRDERHHWRVAVVAAIGDIVSSSGVGLVVDAVSWLGRWRGCHHHGRSCGVPRRRVRWDVPDTDREDLGRPSFHNTGGVRRYHGGPQDQPVAEPK